MMRRNKPLEAHNRVYQNKPIGSQLLVGINPPKKKFPRHGRYVPVPVKRKYYRQSNNGFMIMGQPTAQPPLGIEAITKIISGIQMREPVRANVVQNIPAHRENPSYERNFEQMFSAINELRETQETLLRDSESSVASPFYQDDIGAGRDDQDMAETVSNPGTISSTDDSILRDLEDYESVEKPEPIPSGPEPPDPEPIPEPEPIPAPISIPEPEIPADDDDLEERSGVAGISYGAMTVAMMKTELRAAGLRVSGNRADLIERLKVYKRTK